MSRRALRIAVVTSGDPAARSGAARNLAQTIIGLRALGHDVLRIVGDDRPLAGDDAQAAIRERLRRQASDCDQAFRSWRPDLVHIEFAGPFGQVALATATALRLKATSYWHPMHETVAPAARATVLASLVAFHRRAARTFVGDESDAVLLHEAGVPGVVTAGRGVDTALFAPDARSDILRRAWGAGDSDPVLLHAGRLIAVKNLELLARAADAARAAVPATRVVIAGDGEQRASLQELLPWATFTGSLGEHTLAEVYASADAFIFPSRIDAFGNVVIEAMACALAVVAFDRGAAERHLRDGDNGRRIRPGDDQAFIDATVAMARDPVLARRLGAAARAAAPGFSLATVVAALEREMQTVAASA